MAFSSVLRLKILQGLSVGGNVSAALQYIADSVCYQSVRRYCAYTALLGQCAVFTLEISDQLSQLDAFVERYEPTLFSLFKLA